MKKSNRLHRACKQCTTVLPVLRRNEEPHEAFPHYDAFPHCKYDDEVKVFVFWTEDPFLSEIHEDHTLMWLCNACHYNLLMEV